MLVQVDNGNLPGLADHKAADLLQVSRASFSSTICCGSPTAPAAPDKGCMLMWWARVQLWVKDGRGWVRLPSSKLKADSGGLADLYMEMLLQGKHSQISDFDDHLNDLAK